VRRWFPGSHLVALLVPLTLLATAACDTSTSAPPATVTPASTPAAFPRTVTDSTGKALRLDRAPKRVISLSPGATEALFAIGAGGQVVATDRFSDFPPEAAATEKLDYSQPSAEAVVALHPDLVIMATRQQAQVDQFRALQLPVLFMEEPKTVQAVIESIRFYGGITGHSADADALAAKMETRIAKITSQVPAGDGPRVFYELSPQLYSAAPDSFIGSMLTLLRAQNVAKGAKTPFPQLSAEAVIASDPQVVLLADAGERSGGQSASTVAARPGWAGLAAVRSGHIYQVNPDLVNRPGPRVIDGLAALAVALYPDRFPPTAAATATATR
jgi:iron complex transport system substrate-binding protein